MRGLWRLAMLGTSLFALPGMVWGQQPVRSLEQLQVLLAPGDDLTVVHRLGATTRGRGSPLSLPRNSSLMWAAISVGGVSQISARSGFMRTTRL